MMSLGGFTNYTVSFTEFPNGDADPDTFGVQEQEGDISIYNSTEIFFNGSAETDGGLQVSARVELEGSTTGDQIDEHWIAVSGGFGELEIGANDSADERTAKGILYNNTAVEYWYYDTMTVPSYAGYRGLGQNDGMGLNYTTPSLGGATFAISYKPSAEGNNDNTAVTFGDENLFAVGASYSGDMGGITVGASFGYHQHDLPDARVTAVGDTTNQYGGITLTSSNSTVIGAVETDVSAWGIGVEVGFGDTTLYVRHQDESSEAELATSASEIERAITALAVSHAIGPAKLGLGWVQSTSEAYSESGSLQVEVAEYEDTMVVGSVDYTLGEGVVLAGYVAWGKAEQAVLVVSDQIPGGVGIGTLDESGTALGVALNLAF